MTELETRKRRLVAESEVYRELLKLELQNFRIYGMNVRQKLTSLTPANPLLMTAVPFLTSLLGRKRRSAWQRFGTLALMGWQLYRRFSGTTRNGLTRAKAEDAVAAAEEYLARNI